MITVCQIVKNEAENLKKTLPLAVQNAAQVVVVDTGSSDETVALATAAGASVQHFAWISDFAAARNYSLTFATQPWILWLDADECLTQEGWDELNRLVSAADESVDGFEVTITESPWGETVRGTSYTRVKLFRNGRGFTFAKPINEQLVDRAGRFVEGAATNVVLYHWGKHLSAEKTAVKNERYAKLYADHLAKEPHDPYVNFLLGNLLTTTGQPAAAYAAYAKTAEFGGQDIKIKVDALNRMAELSLKLGEAKRAYAESKQVLALAPDNVGARNILATLMIGVNQPDSAIQILKEVIAKENINCQDPARERLMPRLILVKALQQTGRTDEAATVKAEADKLAEELNARPA